jgi:hypothetical protein
VFRHQTAFVGAGRPLHVISTQTIVARQQESVMFPDIIKAYADAMYVATTLRPPVSEQSRRENERFADCRQHGRPAALRRLVGWLAGWRAPKSIPASRLTPPATPTLPSLLPHSGEC